MTFQKEQAPARYAERLSRLGFTTLIFDPRYRGQSGGLPRCYENPAAKAEDLSAALDYLAGRDDVDTNRIAVLGICMGAGHVAGRSRQPARRRRRRHHWALPRPGGR
jgi:hypothetical protein